MPIIHSSPQFLSAIRMIGTLTIHVRDAKTRAILRTLTKRNTITYDAGDVVRSLIAQRATDYAPATLQMGSMRFGTNNTAPTRSDTDLLGEVVPVRKQLLDVNKINGVSGEISFQTTLQATDGNGNTFNEAGLFTRGATWNDSVGPSLLMFSRQIHGDIAKTSGLELDYNWTIQFTT